MIQNNQKGQAIWELVSASAVVAILVSGVLLAAYIMFARAWLLYQSEQALYCLAEKRGASSCRMAFKSKIDRFLPWGVLTIQNLTETSTGATIQISWGLADHSIRIQRKLDLSWSTRSHSYRYF